MANLAIKGHQTKGKEVIEILEMLGGTNRENCWGVFENRLYTINDFGVIEDESSWDNSNYQIYTLEEFLEKFPYRVGDKVKVPYEDGRITGNELYEYKILKIKWDYLESTIKYGLPTGNEQCIEYYSTDNLNMWNKKETMEEIKIDIPKGYEFAGVDNDKQQVVFNKIQSQYPKTYEECCEILGIRSDWHLTLELDTPATHDLSVTKEFDYVIKLESLRKLSICRDAYWKIAGERMGLGKPWEPDFTNNDEERYGIYTLANKVEKDFCGVGDVNTILVFPTEEMRDAFLDSKEIAQLIENCKEFL